MKEIYRKLILLGLVLFIVIGAIYTYQQGKKQDVSYAADYQSYQLSLAYLQEGDNETAIAQLMELHNRYPDQANITWHLGLSYALERDMDKAIVYFQKAVDQRPFIIQEPLFTLQFAEVLFAKEEYAAAKQYLEHSKTIALPEEYKPRVDELLAQIETNK